MLLGLGARLAALPMAFTMLVAILTAKRDRGIDGFQTLLGFEEWSYLIMFLTIALIGPGASRSTPSSPGRAGPGARRPSAGAAPARTLPRPCLSPIEPGVPPPPASAALLEAVRTMRPVRTRVPARDAAAVLAVGLVWPVVAVSLGRRGRTCPFLPVGWVVVMALAWTGGVVAPLVAALLPRRGEVLADTGRAGRVAAVCAAAAGAAGPVGDGRRAGDGHPRARSPGAGGTASRTASRWRRRC